MGWSMELILYEYDYKVRTIYGTKFPFRILRTLVVHSVA